MEVVSLIARLKYATEKGTKSLDRFPNCEQRQRRICAIVFPTDFFVPYNGVENDGSA